MIEKVKAHKLVVVVAIAFVLGIFAVIQCLSKSSIAAESEVVTNFSDEGTRRGNNVYGYVDIPEQLTEMTGSFNPESDVYGGIRDGVNKGVSFSGESSLFMSMTILDANSGLEDYIAIGEDEYVPFGEKGKNLDSEKAESQFTEQLFEFDKRITFIEGGFVYMDGMQGMESMWEIEENGSTYFYKIYFLDDPNRDNVIHCICARYQESQMDSMDCLSTFSFSDDGVRKDEISPDEVERVGSDVNGYVNIPKGYYNYSGKYRGNDDVNAVYICNKEDLKTGNHLNETMVMVTFKQAEVEENVIVLIKPDLTDMLAHLNIYKWSDNNNDQATHLFDNVKDESKQLNAESVSNIIQQTLDDIGDVQYTATELGGMKGYQITWAGRYDNHEKGYATFYVLDGATTEEKVHIVAARTNLENGAILQLPSSFSFEK